jgi:hypothetical protein
MQYGASNRYPDDQPLYAVETPRWRESDGLRRLPAAFERVLPLRKPSDLARREIVQFVLSASGGLTGEISTMLNNAAELAIRNGDKLIDMTHLVHVCRITQERGRPDRSPPGHFMKKLSEAG